MAQQGLGVFTDVYLHCCTERNRGMDFVLLGYIIVFSTVRVFMTEFKVLLLSITVMHLSRHGIATFSKKE